MAGTTTCLVGCDRKTFSRGFCKPCYKRVRRSEDHFGDEFKIYDAKKSRASWAGVTCRGDDCERPVHAQGLCTMHLRRAKPPVRIPLTKEGRAENARKKRERDARLRQENPGLYTAQKRKHDLAQKHGLTPEDYAEQLAAQEGGCAICGRPCPTGRNLAVDHDHTCCPPHFSCANCRRGLLCTNCNQAIGKLQDDPELISRALEYVTIGGVWNG